MSWKSRRLTYQTAALVLLKETGVTVQKWRATNTGAADILDDEWGIEVPEPAGPISFGVFAHEVGHQLLHRHQRKPRWREEVEAEEYALAQFDRFRLEGRERYERHAAKHIGYSFAKAIRRSKKLTAEIPAAYPEWWAKAEAADAASFARPSLSAERRALDGSRAAPR